MEALTDLYGFKPSWLELEQVWGLEGYLNLVFFPATGNAGRHTEVEMNSHLCICELFDLPALDFGPNFFFANTFSWFVVNFEELVDWKLIKAKVTLWWLDRLAEANYYVTYSCNLS